MSTSESQDTHVLTIGDLRNQICEWLSIPTVDLEIIDFCLAVFVSHRIPGDPLWGMIVDASGGGKTELLRAFRGHPDSYFLSKLTEKSLTSGYRDKDNPKDLSLLPQLNEKVLIVKDFAPILEMRRETRNKILADFRDAYDGFSDNATGRTGTMNYESRFTFLVACTLAIERFDSVEQELGERTVKFRARGEGCSLAKTQKAIDNIGCDSTMRDEMQRLIRVFLESIGAVPKTIPEKLRRPLAILFTARARSHVSRDRRGDLQYVPRPEVGTRLGKELGKLLLALAAVRGHKEPDKADLATVIRVADDSLPPNRLAVIDALRHSKLPLDIKEIKQATNLPDPTARRILDDLRVLGILERQGDDPKELLWSLAATP